MLLGDQAFQQGHTLPITACHVCALTEQKNLSRPVQLGLNTGERPSTSRSAHSTCNICLRRDLSLPCMIGAAGATNDGV